MDINLYGNINKKKSTKNITTLSICDVMVIFKGHVLDPGLCNTIIDFARRFGSGLKR